MLKFYEKLPKFFGAFLLLSLFGLSSCATYYEKNLKFQEAYVEGDFEKADNLLGDPEKASEGRNRLLFFLHKGVVLHMLGKYEESNQYFEKAYIFLEDYKTNYGMEALSLVSNSSIKTYQGEDHEKVLLHYYKALNYLNLNQPSSALVECKRLNIKLQALNDKYEGKKNRYKNDAFAHLLMGIAYDMDKDVNNAFIAYRNAYDAYKTTYSQDFGVGIPNQLKKDLLRTAYLNGFVEELIQYEKEFATKYVHTKQGDGELVFFWNNGLGPIKSEWSVNFTIVKGEGGEAFFVNEQLGLRFPYRTESDEEKSGGIGDLKIVRVAFPKYLIRPPVFQNASLEKEGIPYPLEKAENIQSIALSVLNDRMLREFATSLTRLALKQSAEEALRNENEELGTLISVFNAATEKADTRNWQTLPNSIHYSRVPLELGLNKISFKTNSKRINEDSSIQENFEFVLEEEGMIFHIYSNMDSFAPMEP